MDILRVYSAHSRKKTTLNFLDAYNFLKVQFVRNKLKTGKEYVSFHLREIRPPKHEPKIVHGKSHSNLARNSL